MVTVTSETVAGTQYVFRFSVSNPACPQSPPAVSIVASPLCFEAQPMCADLSTPENSSTGFYQPYPGDAQALLVKALTFRIAAIWQKNPYPGANNTVHVEIATTVNQPVGTRLTLSGLVGSNTLDNPSQVLSFPDSDSESLASSSDSSHALSSTAIWYQLNGTLVISVKAEITAIKILRFAFVLQNPLCCQGGRNVTLTSNLPYSIDAALEWRANTAMATGEVGETAPMFVRCPAWKSAIISASSN